MTPAMTERLIRLLHTGEIKSGGSYHLMPSDCQGDGYDIALTSRPIEDGVYEIEGHKIVVSCDLKVGSRSWHNGIPVRYSVEVDPVAPYTLKAGEKAVIIHRTGKGIGNSYMHRELASIAIRRADGSLVYSTGSPHSHTPYWLGSTNTYAAHYISGMSKRDHEAYKADVAALQVTVDAINSGGK